MPLFSTVWTVSLACLSAHATDAAVTSTPVASQPPTPTRAAPTPSLDVEGAFQMLHDVEAPDAARRAAFHTLATATWTVQDPRFRARFDALLRALATDRQADLRVLALERLAAGGDAEGEGFARRLLVDGLEGTGPALVPAAKAAMLLAGDAHHAARPTLRRLAATSSGDTREMAVRSLAGDVASTEMFEALFLDLTAPPALRRVAALNLNGVAPERFAGHAPARVLDDREDLDLRITVLTAVSFDEAVRRRVDSADFRAKLAALKRRTASADLKRVIERYVTLADGKPLP